MGTRVPLEKESGKTPYLKQIVNMFVNKSGNLESNAVLRCSVVMPSTPAAVPLFSCLIYFFTLCSLNTNEESTFPCRLSYFLSTTEYIALTLSGSSGGISNFSLKYSSKELSAIALECLICLIVNCNATSLSIQLSCGSIAVIHLTTTWSAT